MTRKKKDKSFKDKEEFFELFYSYIIDRNNETLKEISNRTDLDEKSLKEIIDIPGKLEDAIKARKKMLLFQFWVTVPTRLLYAINDQLTPPASLATLANTYAKLLNIYNYAKSQNVYSNTSNSASAAPKLMSVEDAITKGTLPFTPKEDFGF